MNMKTYRRQRNLKTKLMAAVCMLLVSSLMMITSTYAWFTLSTAPEVTGITTAVGANGNLEMALMPETGNVLDIVSAVGDSMEVKNVKLANVTWGNLVKLDSGYGLDQITLYPSELNKTGNVINELMLKHLLTAQTAALRNCYPIQQPVFTATVLSCLTQANMVFVPLVSLPACLNVK